MDRKDRVIPLTEPGPLWSQREYVACMQIGVGFSAHYAGGMHQFFHYHFPTTPPHCTTVEIKYGSQVERYVDHEFKPGIKWIDQCREAMAMEKYISS